MISEEHQMSMVHGAGIFIWDVVNIQLDGKRIKNNAKTNLSESI